MVEAAAGATLESVDILQIMNQLPHRYPFLLVDRIFDIRGDESCVGVKNVTVNEPQFQGHFPERPIMPGVLLIEAMAQTAGVIAIRATEGRRPVASRLFRHDRQCEVSQARDARRPRRIPHDEDCAEAQHLVVCGEGDGRRRAGLRGADQRHDGRVGSPRRMRQ